jgi:hypothetical protein
MSKLKEVAQITEAVARKLRRDAFTLDALDLKWLELRLEHCREIVRELLEKPEILRGNHELAFSTPKRSLGLKRTSARRRATS